MGSKAGLESLLDPLGRKIYPSPMASLPDFQSLALQEPRLADLERRAQAVQDDQQAEFFCSNYLWLPMYTALRDLIGAQRRPQNGEAREGVLFDSFAFEEVYLHLSRQLPPCRNCGCRRFQALLDAGGRG